MAKPPAQNTRLTSCFSFAAYSKIILNQLNNLSIPILPGLNDQEIHSLESSLNFIFPSDLRSILQVGIPIGPHFPNWRSSSPQQLQILLNLPFLNLSKNILHNNFWLDSWGHKPHDCARALAIAKRFLDKAPVLVPVYGNCYIPALPNAAGNPIFYIDHCCVRVLSFDLSRFFQELEFFQTGGVHLIKSVNIPREKENPVDLPAWAATTARRIDFWTELAEKGRRMVARVDTRAWWSVSVDLDEWELGRCLEEVFWRLRDGGWKEEEVREMMMMMDGCDEDKESGDPQGDVAWRVSLLSGELLRAGWSREDVVYSLDLNDVADDESVMNKSCFDLQIWKSNNCSREDDDRQNSRVKHLMNLPPLKV